LRWPLPDLGPCLASTHGALVLGRPYTKDLICWVLVPYIIWWLQYNLIIFIVAKNCKNKILKEITFVKENKGCSGLFWNVLFSKWNLQNQLIMWQICAQAAPLIWKSPDFWWTCPTVGLKSSESLAPNFKGSIVI